MTIESSSAAGVEVVPVLPFAFLRGGILRHQLTVSWLIRANATEYAIADVI